MGPPAGSVQQLMQSVRSPPPIRSPQPNPSPRPVPSPRGQPAPSPRGHELGGPTEMMLTNATQQQTASVVSNSGNSVGEQTDQSQTGAMTPQDQLSKFVEQL